MVPIGADDVETIAFSGCGWFRPAASSARPRLRPGLDAGWAADLHERGSISWPLQDLHQRWRNRAPTDPGRGRAGTLDVPRLVGRVAEVARPPAHERRARVRPTLLHEHVEPRKRKAPRDIRAQSRRASAADLVAFRHGSTRRRRVGASGELLTQPGPGTSQTAQTQGT